MALVQSLVHSPLVLTATTVTASTASTSTSTSTSEYKLSTDLPPQLRSPPSRYSLSEELITNLIRTISHGIFSQPLPQHIPRLFINNSQRNANRYAIYILTKHALCSCGLQRLLRTVSANFHSPSQAQITLADPNNFTIVLAPGYDFSGPAEKHAFQLDQGPTNEPPQTYTLADVLSYHLSLLATGSHKIAPGRFLVLVHEDWLANGLLLVEFDVPSTGPARKLDPQASDSSESLLTPDSEDQPTPRPDIASLDYLSRQTKVPGAAAAGQLGFLRIGADWAWNALRLLQDGPSHWSELKEVELTAEWADDIEGYTGTEWQTMGFEGSLGPGLMPAFNL